MSNTTQSHIEKGRMKLALFISAFAGASAFAPAKVNTRTSALSESKADLEALAAKLNPALKFYDPLVSFKIAMLLTFLCCALHTSIMLTISPFFSRTLLMPISGQRVMKPLSVGSVNPKSSMVVLPCLLSSDTASNLTLFSHGLRPSLVRHIHRSTCPRKHSGMLCLSVPSGKSLLSSPC
jgi:hypothetical protein